MIDAGALIAIRSIIINAFWMFVTSVVIRVTRPAVENLSIFAKEYVWIFLNIALRRFFPSPMEAFEPYLAPRHPHMRAKSAANIIHIPMTYI